MQQLHKQCSCLCNCCLHCRRVWTEAWETCLVRFKTKACIGMWKCIKRSVWIKSFTSWWGKKKSLNNWNEHERDCRVMVLTKVVSIRGNLDCYDVTQAVTWKIWFCFWTFFRVNNRSLGKLIKSARSLITELQVQKIHITFSIQSCLTTSGMV